MTASLRAEDVRYSYGDVVALDGVDLAVRDGETRAVIGPNGAGKSTLFRTIAGDLVPDEGRVVLGDRDVTNLPPHRRTQAGLGRSFQIDELFEGLTVRENIMGALAIDADGRGWVGSASAVRGVEDLAERVGLGDRLDVEPPSLSHGDRRRLDLGLALATAPDVLLLDEPTAGLAGHETAAIERLLADLAGDVTLVVVEHDVDLVMALADVITVLHEGRVIAEGDPESVREDERVAEVYLGGGAR